MRVTGSGLRFKPATLRPEEWQEVSISNPENANNDKVYFIYPII